MHLVFMTEQNIPDQIITARKSLGLNQAEFADALGVDQATISRWESGKITPSGPAIRLLGRLVGESQEAAE